MKNKHQDDPWSQLVSDLGLEDASKENVQDAVAQKTPVSEEGVAGTRDFSEKTESSQTSEPDRPEKPVECSRSEISTPAATNVEKSGEGKKTFFGRFPKINLFGNSSKDTLESVVESSKTPSLSGKSFTSKTVEKVPLSLKRESSESKSAEKESSTKPPRREDVPSPPKKTPTTEPPRPVAVDPSDPWSQIASQVGILSSIETREAVVEETKVETASRGDRQNGRGERGRGRRNLPSLFDEETPEESEESVALKNLIESEPDSSDESAKRLRSLFDDDDRKSAARSENQPRRAESRKAESREEGRSEERGSRRRGRKDERREDRNDERDERPAATERPRRSDRDERDADFAAPSGESRVRGRRGARFVREAEKIETEVESERVENDFEADEDFREDFRSSTWDIEEESKPVERSSRGRRRRGSRVKDENREAERPVGRRDYAEPEEEDTFSEETSDFARLHRNIPSWDDAIALIIDGNIARHGQRSSESRRGRR